MLLIVVRQQYILKIYAELEQVEKNLYILKFINNNIDNNKNVVSTLYMSCFFVTVHKSLVVSLVLQIRRSFDWRTDTRR